jgi:hypothetical protein
MTSSAKCASRIRPTPAATLDSLSFELRIPLVKERHYRFLQTLEVSGATRFGEVQRWLRQRLQALPGGLRFRPFRSLLLRGSCSGETYPVARPAAALRRRTRGPGEQPPRPAAPAGTPRADLPSTPAPTSASVKRAGIPTLNRKTA